MATGPNQYQLVAISSDDVAGNVVLAAPESRRLFYRSTKDTLECLVYIP